MSKENKYPKNKDNSENKYPFLTKKSDSEKKDDSKSQGDFSKFIKKSSPKPEYSDRNEEKSDYKPRNGDYDNRSQSDRPLTWRKTDAEKDRHQGSGKPSYDKPRSDRPYTDRNRRSYDNRDKDAPRDNPFGERKNFERRFPDNFQSDRTNNQGFKRDNPFERNDKPFERNDKPFERRNTPFERGSERRFPSNYDSNRQDRQVFVRTSEIGADGEKKYKDSSEDPFAKPYRKRLSSNDEDGKRLRPFEKRPRISEQQKDADDGVLRLNKFVAQSGLCSRRKAAEIVKNGEIKVNGKVESNPAYEVKESDVITHKDKPIKKEEKFIYLLMNKPKNTITSVSDEKGRKTVLDLVRDYSDYRLFPVGRLDRNTTGLLLLTNDGDLSSKLSHPSFRIKKYYHVVLDKNLKPSDLDDIRSGIALEDGIAEVDFVNYIKGAAHNEVGIEIHIGKNRIVRRIFEHLGYVVEKLDRTYYAGLTKKDLPRGFSRELSQQEIIMLKHFTQGK